MKAECNDEREYLSIQAGILERVPVILFYYIPINLLIKYEMCDIKEDKQIERGQFYGTFCCRRGNL